MNPFWYDEAFFGMAIRNGIWRQEYIAHFIAWIFRLDTDFGLRFVSAFFGTLSIPAVYFVLKKNKWIGVLFIAFNPLFIFWSQMARPYAVAGFFCILAWRWWWFYVPALATTFISIVTFRGTKKIFLFMLSLMLMSFFIRPDIETGNWFQYLGITVLSGRLWYLPMIALILYACDYVINFLYEMEVNKKALFVIGLAIGVFFLLPNQTWYRQDVSILSDWRNCGQLDFATEFNNAAWYGGGNPGYFQHYNQRKIDSLLFAGDTLRIGLGQLALGSCRRFTERYVGSIEPFYREIASGGVVKLKLWYDNKFYFRKYDNPKNI